MGVGSHSKESDVFAFGMVMIEVGVTNPFHVKQPYPLIQIFTGKEPFSESLDCTAIESIVAGDRPKRATDTRFTDRLWTLVQQCWGQRPQDRPRMDQVIMELSVLSLKSGDACLVTYFPLGSSRVPGAKSLGNCATWQKPNRIKNLSTVWTRGVWLRRCNQDPG